MSAPPVPLISGTTVIYGHLAHPSAHVRTPQVLNAAFVERGIDAAAVSMDVHPDDLGSVVRGVRGWRNLAGLGVTMPHKEEIVRYLDVLTPGARQVGAVNFVRREADGTLVGDCIDGIGFVGGLRRAGHHPSGRTALLVGTGGAGRAIAFALLDAGVTGLRVSNRTASRAEALAAELRAGYPGRDITAGPADPGGRQLIVNATSLGMRPDDPLPVELAAAPGDAVVAEIIMTPATTRLLTEAAARGLLIHRGLPMLQCQVELIIQGLGLGSPAGADGSVGAIGSRAGVS